MKKLFFAALAAATLVTGCAGKYTDNKVFGHYPSIYKVYNQEMKALPDQMRDRIGSTKDGKRIMAIRDEFEAREKELKNEASQAGAEELAKIAGRDIPFDFEGGFDTPDFEIESVSLVDGDASAGTLHLCVVVKAKQEVKCSPRAVLHFLAVNPQNEGFYSGKINPFVHMPGGRAPYTGSVEEGEYCHEDGSMIYLNCSSFDFTNFDRLLFISEQTYKAIH